MFATGLQRWAYKHLAKPVFFKSDPEEVHDRATRVGIMAGKSAIVRRATNILYHYQGTILSQNISGIDFPNPIGFVRWF